MDWTKVAVNTPILVSADNEHWIKVHYAKVVNDFIGAYVDGATSYTTEEIGYWMYAKLLPVSEENIYENLRVDRLKLDFIQTEKVKMHELITELPYVACENVEVNTPILVRDASGETWKVRHFAKCDKGKVYAYVGGKTSYTCALGYLKAWKYVKLFPKIKTEEQGLLVKVTNDRPLGTQVHRDRKQFTQDEVDLLANISILHLAQDLESGLLHKVSLDENMDVYTYLKKYFLEDLKK